MSELPACPNCKSIYAYEDASMFICPECNHEWSAQSAGDEIKSIRDANGNDLKEGDTVTLIKDLKIKGSSTVLKVGTKAKIMRLNDGDHDIDCRIQGAGSMELKSQFVKKASD